MIHSEGRVMKACDPVGNDFEEQARGASHTEAKERARPPLQDPTWH